MIVKLGLLAAAGLFTMAAGPLPVYPQVAYNAPTSDLLQPAPPQAEPRFSPAPVPNLDLTPPTRSFGRKRTELTPEVFGSRLPRTYQGEGFVPGSSVQNDQGKKPRLQQLAPGLNLSVPLE